MYKNMLIATDGSALAHKAVRAGLELAKSLDATVTLVTVTERWPVVEVAAQAEMGVKDPVGHYEALAEKGAQSTLAAATEIATEVGIDCVEVHVKDQPPASGILEIAQKIDADLIVLASHGRRGVDKILLGSVANEVLTRTKVPILIIR